MEQCAAGGKASAVERCVLRLDLASLDFNQVRTDVFLDSIVPVSPIFSGPPCFRAESQKVQTNIFL